MQKREYVLALYEIYKKLLTELEQKYFEYYYFEDYSMQEIADALNVSKANIVCQKSRRNFPRLTYCNIRRNRNYNVR